MDSGLRCQFVKRREHGVQKRQQAARRLLGREFRKPNHIGEEDSHLLELPRNQVIPALQLSDDRLWKDAC